MLSAVPPLADSTSWVQVLGRVAVHLDGDTQRLTGSGQRLLAVLVAAGTDGATAERIAEEIWGEDQPDPWRPALRMAVARLRKRLPLDWDIVADGGSYRITTGAGWIDAWRLEATASTRTLILEADLSWMLAGAPFGDLDLLEMVGASTQNLKMLQITVAERFCAQEPATVATATCTSLISLMRDHPYNDRLAFVVSTALANAGRRNEALLALTEFADSYAADFGELPPDIARFLTSGGQGEGATSSSTEPVPDTTPVEIPKELRHLTDSPLLGRRAELDALRASRGALVTGATGSGKSTLLAALIAEDATTETTYVVGDDRLDLALGPFAVAMPELRDELLASARDEPAPTREERAPAPATATRAWRLVLAHLEGRSTVRPQRLIVDDAHLLDPASLSLLRLLIRSNTTADLTFVVCGRNDFDDVAWLDLSRDAERAGLDPIELGGLEVTDVEAMVYEQFPQATSQARHGLAVEVHEASGGMPAVAAPLIASVDEDTLALPEQLAGVPALARVTASLSERAPEVVAAAAVLGHQFSIGALIALTELDESAIFRVLDELWATSLIVETDDPDQVRFRHVLIQRAFLDGVPLFRRGQLHRRAAELTEDPHARADHQANASALVPAEVAAESLLVSAKLFANRRQWRKVARELRRMDDLPGEYLDAAAHSLWAAALDRSGADGSAHRRVAYDLAVEAHDWAAALDAALSGLPEAERPDGDRERIEMIEAIPPSALAQPQRFDRVSSLCRQYSLLGDDDKVVAYSNEALAIASDPDEVGAAHVLRWTATRHHQKLDINPIPPELATTGSLHIRLRIAQINAINLAEEGDFAAARIAADHFKDLATEDGDPLRLWHAQALEGLFLMNDGDFDGAEAVALENLKFAELHDLQQGTASYIGLRVFSFDCQERLRELQPQIEPFRANLASIMLGRVALALTAHSVGEPMSDEVRAIVSEATMREGGTMSLLSMVFLARFLPEHAPDLVAPTRHVLQRFGDRPILASFGAVSFGPTSRYVAQLSADIDEKKALLRTSIEAADRHGTLLWRVKSRLDHAHLGVPSSLDEAVDLAAGTGLEDLVARHVRSA